MRQVVISNRESGAIYVIIDTLTISHNTFCMLLPSSELQYVKRIYILLFALILINPLLSKFVPITTILRSMEILCYAGILFYEYKLYKNNSLRSLHSYEKWLYILLFLISVSIVIRGNWPNSPKDFALHILATPRYLLPFIIVSLPNAKYFNQIIILFYKISFWVIPLWIINVTDLVQIGTSRGEGIGALLPFISAFLLGFGCFFSKRQRMFNIMIWAIFFLLMMLNARRNVAFSLLLYAFIAYVFSITMDMKKNIIKSILTILISILIGLFLILKMDALSSGLFRNMSNRVSEDTRSGVEELFFADFANSPITDWIFGRGMDGGYYQITIDAETGEISDNRTAIETGYLNMILKGGMVYDVVIILIMLLAVRRGYGRKNRTCSFLATILLTYFIDLYTTNPVCAFSVRSILFWFCISVLSANVPIFKQLQLIRNGKRTSTIDCT